MRNLFKIFIATILLFVMFSGNSVVLGQTRRLERPSVKSVNQTSEKRIALVIGNGAYTKAQPLPNPTNDALDMTATLQKLGFEVISGTNLDKREMETLIRQFGTKLAGGGVGLFYYAGHGIQMAGENYLIPIDADIPEENEISYAAVSISLVLSKMAAARNNLNIVVLDACRNNPFARSWRTYRDAGNNQGLAKISPPTGTLVLYATEPGKVASDGSGRNGLFTESLLRQITVPGVEYEQMVKAVATDVWQRSNQRQLPWKEGISLKDFYFATENTKPKTQSPAVANNTDAAVIEKEFWESIKSSTDADDFYLYKERYPSGFYVNLADLNIKRLTRLTSPAQTNTVTSSESNRVNVNTPISNNSTNKVENKNDYDIKIRDYTKNYYKVVTINPKYGVTYTLYIDRASAYYYENRYDAAIRDYNKAIELMPKYPLAYYNRGSAYYYKKDYDAAIRDFSKVIEIDPKDAEAYSSRAVAYMAKGRNDLAEADQQKYKELISKSASTTSTTNNNSSNTTISSDTKISWLEGVWEGTGNQINPKTTWRMKLTARNTTYLIEYLSLSCGGEWVLVNQDLSGAKFNEKITYGVSRCSNNGNIIIEKISESRIAFRYSSPGSTEINATAILNKK